MSDETLDKINADYMLDVLKHLSKKSWEAKDMEEHKRDSAGDVLRGATTRDRRFTAAEKAYVNARVKFNGSMQRIFLLEELIQALDTAITNVESACGTNVTFQ